MKRRLGLPRFSIRTLLVLMVIGALISWDHGRQRAYDRAMEQFRLVFPSGFMLTEEPSSIRKFQSQISRLVGLPISNRQVKTLEIYPEDVTQVTELSLQQAQFLGELPPARNVILTNFEFSPNAISIRLRREQSTLTLAGCRLRNGALKDLRIPFLQTLRLESCESFQGLDDISDSFPNLKQLAVGFCSGLGNISKSAACKQLESLELSGPSINNDVLTGVETLKGLSMLSIWDAPITDAPLAKIGLLSKLQIVQLRRTHVSSNTLAQLAQLPRLERLTLSNNQGITDDGIVHLQGMLQLKELRIDGIPEITDNSADALGSLAGLTTLWMQGTRVGRKTAQRVARLQELNTLMMDWDDILVDDILPLASSKIHYIHYKWRDRRNQQFDGGTLTRLEMRWLAGLDSCQNSSMELSWLKGLQGVHLKAWPLDVSSVDLHGCQLTQSALDELALRTAIRKLDLSRTNVDATMLNCLASLESLQELSVSDCPNIDDRILELVDRLPSLVRLNVKGTRVTANMPELLKARAK